MDRLPDAYTAKAVYSDDIGSRKGRGPASGEGCRNKQPSLYLSLSSGITSRARRMNGQWCSRGSFLLC